MTHRRRLKASRYLGFEATVSERALKVAGSCLRGFDHQYGTKPQRMRAKS
jgi:hypothetical protein